MAHESIQTAAHGDYDEGDTLHINIEVKDRLGVDPYDITGGEIAFYLKEDWTDTDDEAVLTKTSTDDPDDVEITDGSAGLAVVRVRAEETAGLLNDGEERLPEKTFKYTVRITDADGNRTTPVKGDWTITAS